MEVNGAVHPHLHTPSWRTTLTLKQLTWLVHNSEQVFQNAQTKQNRRILYPRIRHPGLVNPTRQTCRMENTYKFTHLVGLTPNDHINLS